MSEFIDVIVSFPTVIYSLLLVVVVLYWVFVMIGAVDLDLFDAADGADGLLDAVHAAKGAEGLAEASHASGVFEVLALLGLKKAPITVVGSLLIVWSWLLSYLGVHFLGAAGGVLVSALIFAGAFAIAVPLTSICVRPLGRLFETSRATERKDLVGKTCIISTGSVSARFGQATYEVPGESMLLQVRSDKPNKLEKGDEALIIEYDARREAYLVEAMEPLLIEGGSS